MGKGMLSLGGFLSQAGIVTGIGIGTGTGTWLVLRKSLSRRFAQSKAGKDCMRNGLCIENIEDVSDIKSNS
jgi:hypothetical protein